MNVDKIIDDYVNCREKTCCECEADRKIDNTDCSCCKLLTSYRVILQDKINEVIVKN